MEKLESKIRLGFLETATVGKVEVYQDGNKFYYFNRSQARLFPLAKKYIKF